MRKLLISGPKGNAFVIFGIALNLAKQLELDSDAIQAEMTSGDYNHMLDVFVAHFGYVVQLVSEYELPGVDADLYLIEENDYI